MCISLLNSKQDYVEFATEKAERQLSDAILTDLFTIEMNALLLDGAEIIEELFELDTAIHLKAGEIPPDQWEETYRPIEENFQRAIAITARLIAVGERLRSLGLNLPGLNPLTEQHQRAVRSGQEIDYLGSEKYVAMMEEAWKEYQEGRTEEGGWDITEEELALVA